MCHEARRKTSLYGGFLSKMKRSCLLNQSGSYGPGQSLFIDRGKKAFL